MRRLASSQRIHLAESLLMRYHSELACSQTKSPFVGESPYVELIRIYCKAGRLEDAVKVLQLLKETPLPTPTPALITPILLSLTSPSHLAFATKALESLLNSPTTPPLPAQLYNRILALCNASTEDPTTIDTTFRNTLSHLLSSSHATGSTFVHVITRRSRTEGPPAIFSILQELERFSHGQMLTKPNVQSALLDGYIRASESSSTPPNEILSGALDLVTRITSRTETGLTPAASVVLAREYLKRGDWMGVERILTDSMTREMQKGRSVSPLATFLGTHVLSSTAFQNGVDGECYWPIVKLWIRCIEASNGLVSAKNAGKVISVLGRHHPMVLRMVYESIQSQSSTRGLLDTLTQPEWSRLMTGMNLENTRIAGSFLRASCASLGDVSFAETVVKNYLSAFEGIDAKHGAAVELLACLNAGRRAKESESETAVRKAAVGVVGAVIKREAMTGGQEVEGLVNSLGDLLGEKKEQK
ncbi:hypothetical protein HDU98_010124 [Podochytrium sp. JEL0797]|nr:hypothetical protein HDU98_010124 [Podochytrium sp. JEL0797]